MRRGRPKKETRSRAVSIYLPIEIIDEGQAIADDKDLSFSKWVAQVLDERVSEVRDRTRTLTNAP